MNDVYFISNRVDGGISFLLLFYFGSNRDKNDVFSSLNGIVENWTWNISTCTIFVDFECYFNTLVNVCIKYVFAYPIFRYYLFCNLDR